MPALAIDMARLLPHDIVATLPAGLRALRATGVAIDSRRVLPGEVFVALRGQRDDGERFIADAAARGACLALVESDTPTVADATATGALVRIGVPHLRAVVGELADRLHGMPSAALSLVGVTGTNGKTTVTWLLSQLLQRVGLPCGVMGTLGAGLVGPGLSGSGKVGQVEGGQLTTADVVTNHAQLAALLASGARAAAMEVSSHALDQQRVAGLRFAVAVFTNLSRDHLDYHGDMESYAAAKHRLLAWPGIAARVIDIDDAQGRRWAGEAGARLLTCGVRSDDAMVRFVADADARGIVRGHLVTPAGTIVARTSLIGEFNASNLAAVVAAALALGIAPTAIERALPDLEAAPGRMQRFESADGVSAVVDYAHTPDGLEKALTALRVLARGRLWCVFGCGGDRDRGKRALMAAVADRLADHVVLTDDNPRTEDPARIFADALSFGATTAHWQCEHDRARAIGEALSSASSGDVVLVAGKGHENYQDIGGVQRPFDDADVVRASLRRRAA
jgi:UDP-N-acetylmuramoyl-L-alanyl-D-glutamate--2,6-diaminopimelate ligase